MDDELKTFDYKKIKVKGLVFDANFENGSMDRVIRLGQDWYHIMLRPDTWYRFHFRVTGCKGHEIIFEFTCSDNNNPIYNEGNARWLIGDSIIKPMISYDGKTWQPAEYIEKHSQDRGKYRFLHTFTENEAFICCHHPYTYTDMLEWLKTLRNFPNVAIGILGKSRNGIPQPVLDVTSNDSTRELVVLIAREDADEQLGSWGVEGLVRGLLAPKSKELLERYIFKIVPMVCIDGVIAGAHHSAGYGYGGLRWHEEPAPVEIQNVKNAFRQWAKDGYHLKLAGKFHSDMFFRNYTGSDGILTSNPKFRDALTAGLNRFYKGAVDTPVKDLAIRPKGYFERFLLDEGFECPLFCTHIRGNTVEDARICGEGYARTICEWLNG